MPSNKNMTSNTSTSDEPLFIQLVAPAMRRALQLQRQFERKDNLDVSEHQSLLNEIEQAEHHVWQAIALATADINPALIADVTAAQPIPLTAEDKRWIQKCLKEACLPLLEEGSLIPIRFLQGRH